MPDRASEVWGDDTTARPRGKTEMVGVDEDGRGSGRLQLRKL